MDTSNWPTTQRSYAKPTDSLIATEHLKTYLNLMPTHQINRQSPPHSQSPINLPNNRSKSAQKNNQKQPRATVLKYQLHMIFLYYCSYGDRNNYRQLKPQNYRRFLVQSETALTEMTLRNCDVVYQKITGGKSAERAQFQKMVVDLAEVRYKGLSRRGAFEEYMRAVLEKLYQEVIAYSQFGLDLTAGTTITQATVPNNLIDQLQANLPLKNIYEDYITAIAAVHTNDTIRCFESLYNFLRDFSISPALTYKAICYAVYCYIIENDNNRLSMRGLAIYLIAISRVVARKETQLVTPEAKLRWLLENMELSSGLTKLSLKHQGQNQPNFTFIKYNTQIDYYQSTDYAQSSNLFNSHRRPFFSNMGSRKEKFQSLIANSKNEQATSHPDLGRVFQSLCSVGEVGNDKTLKSYKIKKLYEKMGLLTKIGQTWLDLAITNLQRQSQTGKIEFEHFINLLYNSADRLEMSQQQFHMRVMSACQLGNLPKVSEALLTPTAMQILQCVTKPIQRIFQHYAGSAKEIQFETVSKFMYDFDLFPFMVSKSRLYQLFVIITDSQKSITIGRGGFDNSARQLNASISGTATPKGGRNTNGFRSAATTNLNVSYSSSQTSSTAKKISFQGLLNLIAMVSQQLAQARLLPEQKFIIAIEKMHQSKGQVKLAHLKSALVTELRTKYRHFYRAESQVDQKRWQKDKDEDFDQLLELYVTD